MAQAGDRPLSLVLVPTEGERSALERAGGFPPQGIALAACGFGPVAAAARTAALLASLRPRRVLLCGVAGTYDVARLAVGGAASFGRVAIDGIGAGGASAAAIGFPHWAGDAEHEAIGDEIVLGEGPLLVTTCSASASPDEARARARRFPGALAEDMEAFGVALACALARTPLEVVRGASNACGDRERSRWRFDEALAAARALALTRLERRGAARP